MKKITFFVSALLITFSTSIFAQKTWTGTTSTAWNTSTNWSPAGAPASTDDVIIPSAPANQPLISGTITPVCKNLTINSGASLNISATSTNNALLTASGNATINGALTIGGSITRTGKLVVVNMTWGSTGTMSGFLNGSMEVSGDWEFSAGSAISMGLCSVTFTGSTTTQIVSKSSSSSFSNVTISKTSSQSVQISTTSTSTLNFGGSVTISTGANLSGPANITTIFSGNLNNSGHFSFNNGNQSFEKTSGTQTIQLNTSDFFNNMIINSGGTVTINNYLTLLNDLTINSGIFDPLGNIVVIFGDWDNNVGPDSFTEGTSRVVFSGGNYHQYCSTENFNILEVNKAVGGAFRVNTGTVTCNQYDWTAGSIDVLNNGTFTALDLADDGIRGNYYVNTGCTINLYQDSYQYVDLGGNLTFTDGGTINVYGGMGYSQWPNFANASITMNGGTLDFVDNGISINNSGTYTFTTNISGGTIRTSKGFYCERADYNPTGGTIQLYGSTDCQLSFTAGTIRSLYINKNNGNTVTLGANTAVNGLFVISTGKLYAINKVITPSNDVTINAGGILHLGMAAQLKMANAKNIHIENGGTLKTEGTLADNAVITHNTTGFYFIYVKNGGTLSANNTYFSYLSYIQFQSGSTLDPANAFYRCTFTNNIANPSGGVIYFNNNQEVSVYQAHFTALNSGYNVYKSNDAGHIYFKDATGSFAGATYEYDPNNRIDWVASTPGLWTGITSSNWNTASNWDDYNVPTAATNVVIPTGTIYNPIIGSDEYAYCKDLILETGTILTQNSSSLLNVDGNLDSEGGYFNMSSSSNLIFRGSTNTFWKDDDDNDNYGWVSILKTNTSNRVELYNRVQCSGGVTIWEGTLKLFSQTKLKILYLGQYALWVMDGGKLESMEAGFIEVAGSIVFEDGSIAEIDDQINCSKDFVANFLAVINFTEPYGLLVMDGTGTQYINNQAGENLSLCNLTIMKPAGTCYLNENDLKLNGWLRIVEGTLSCDNGPSPTATYNIYLPGEWKNLAGPSAFHASFGEVVFTSGGSSNVFGETNFNVLEVDKGTDQLIIKGDVTCAAYNWTSGSIDVNINGSTFTANDLLDNAIKGSFMCQEGGTINLTNSGTGTYVDLTGELHNFGGTINISGSLSYWPYGGNAVVEMTGGVIDLKTCGLTINNNPSLTLTDNITGGTIRTAYGFAGNRADFTPEAGTFEFYSSSDAILSQSNDCKLPNVLINKSAKEGDKSAGGEPIFDVRTGELLSEGGKSNIISLSSPISITGDLTIQSGILHSNNQTINIKGDWNNLVGPDGFVEGTGRVVFTGYTAQLCSNEEFYILELNKPAQLFYNYPEATISCQVYDWTQGGIWIADNGNFYAADLFDNGIYGNWTLYGDSIELHQDFSQSVGIQGNVSIHSGDFDVYGGSWVNSHWGNYSDVNFTMLGGTLDYHDARVTIHEYNPPHLLNINISGGLIRSTLGFFISNPVFQPAGGTLEIYEKFGFDPYLDIDNGASLHELIININSNDFVEVKGHLPVDIVMVNSGELITKPDEYLFVAQSMLVSGPGARYYNFLGNTVFENNAQLVVENGGYFRNWGTLKLGNNSLINVNNNGTIAFGGNLTYPGSVTTSNPSDRYGISVNSDGKLGAYYTHFENLNNNGININPGGIIDPASSLYKFDNCTFSNGTSGAYPLITFNNEQDLVIDFANFPANTWGGQYNVAKTNNAGSVSFRGILGEFAGEAFENDPYNRIHWLDEANQLDVKVWLEGPFNGTDMNTGLTGLPNFPLTQPFNAAPWNYDGAETLTIIPPDVVDWVLVELRCTEYASQAGSDDRLTRCAALLKKDGSIVDLDGTSPVQFSYSPYNNLYAVIHHRNHLSIISSSKCVESSNVYSYDFRTDVTKAYGAGLGYKDLGAGIAAMVGADGNANGTIELYDKASSWTPNVAKKGYFSGDFNLDSQVNNKDKNNHWIPNLDEGFTSQVPE